jgi:hypothetical protein
MWFLDKTPLSSPGNLCLNSLCSVRCVLFACKFYPILSDITDIFNIEKFRFIQVACTLGVGPGLHGQKHAAIEKQVKPGLGGLYWGLLLRCAVAPPRADHHATPPRKK